jgi:hypothetical protein
LSALAIFPLTGVTMLWSDRDTFDLNDNKVVRLLVHIAAPAGY